MDELRERLNGFVAKARDGSGHWRLTGNKLVNIPGVGVVTTRRAIYAAFVGPIPEDYDIVPACGIGECLAPGHAFGVPTRYMARELNLTGDRPDMELLLRRPNVPVEKAKKPPRSQADRAQVSTARKRKNDPMPPKVGSGIPPRANLTPVQVAAVRKYDKAGNSLAQIRALTGISVSDIVRIKNGAFTERGRRVPEEKADLRKVRKETATEIPMYEDKVRTPRPTEVPEGASDEEAQWLKTMVDT